jgi:MFS family permease
MRPGDDAGWTPDRNLKVVSGVSFLQDTASELLYPVLPFLVTGLLGGSAAVLGVIEGLADGTAAASKAVSGRLADRRRRRPLVATGYAVSALGKVLLAAATAWPLVGAARFTDRVGKGLRGPPRDALIADGTTAADRGRAFGFHRAADTAGAVAGPLLGLGLYHLLDGDLRPMLWVAVVPAVLSVALVFAVRERPRPHAPAAVRSEPVHLPARFWRLMGFVGLFSLVNFPDALLLLRAKDLGFGFTGVVLVYVLYNLSYAILSYPAGRLSDRLGRRRIFGTGLAVFSLAYLGFGLSASPGWLWLILPVYGAYAALTDGISRAWVSDVVPPDARGTALGIHAAVSGLGLLAAGLWAGLAWHDTGRGPFVLSGTIAAALAAAVLLGGRSLDPSPPAASATPG